MKKPVLILLI